MSTHFEEVKRATGLPLVAYNVPGRTGVNLTPSTLASLARQGTIIGVKEASGSMDQVLDLLLQTRDVCSILSGEDSLVNAMMASGGKGVISATANIVPELFVEITSAALRGDWERAKEAQFKVLPWVRLMFVETNPIPVKTAVAMKGIIKHATLRLPLCQAEETTVQKIEQLLG